MSIETLTPSATPSNEPLLLASAGVGLTHLEDVAVYEGSRQIGLVRLFQDPVNRKVWAYGQDNSGRAPRTDVTGFTKDQIRYGGYRDLKLYPVHYDMSQLLKSIGYLAGGSSKTAERRGANVLSGLAAQQEQHLRRLGAPQLLSFGDVAKRSLEAITQNVLPKYGVTLGQLFSSKQFYGDPVLVKHLEDASRAYSNIGLSFAQVLDGARTDQKLGDRWMTLQRQSSNRRYVDDQVGLVSNALQAYMQSPNPGSRGNLNNALASVQSNISKLRLNDLYTPAQAKTLSVANYELHPETTSKGVAVGTTVTLKGVSHTLKGEIHVTYKLERTGAWTVASAMLERVTFDVPGRDGKPMHQNLGKHHINVAISNGLHGIPYGVPLTTDSDVKLVARDAMESNIGEILAAHRADNQLELVTIQDGLPDALRKILPNHGGPLRPGLEALSGIGKGVNRFAVDTVRSTLDMAMTVLSGYGEVVNLAGAAVGANNGQPLIPAAHAYATKFHQGLLDLTAFIDQHSSELPAKVGNAMLQEVADVRKMLETGDIAGAAEKLTYAVATIATLAWGAKDLAVKAPGLVKKLEELGKALKQFRTLRQEVASVFRPGGPFRFNHGESFVYKPPVGGNAPSTPVKAPVPVPVAPTQAPTGNDTAISGDPIKLLPVENTKNNIVPFRAKEAQPVGSAGAVPPSKTPVVAAAAQTAGNGGAVTSAPVVSLTPNPEPVPFKPQVQAPVKRPATSASTPSPPEILVFDPSGNPATVSPEVAGSLLRGESVPGYEGYRAYRFTGGSGSGAANRPSRPSSSGGQSPKTPNTGGEKSGVPAGTPDASLGGGATPPGNPPGAASGASGGTDPKLQGILDQVAAARESQARAGAYFYDPATKQTRLVQSKAAITSALKNNEVFVRPGLAQAPPGHREIQAAMAARPRATPAGFQRSLDQMVEARQLDGRNGAHFVDQKTGAKHFVQTEDGFRKASHNGELFVKVGRADEGPSAAEIAAGVRREADTSSGRVSQSQPTQARAPLPDRDPAVEEQMFEAAFNSVPLGAKGAEYLDIDKLLEPEMGAPDRLMVRHRMLEKYAQFKALRDEPIGPKGFRFVEYQVDAKGQPIVRPDAVARVNDYVVDGKRAAWYDRKTNKINVDSEALQSRGIAEPGLPDAMQDPVLKELWKGISSTGEGALSEPSVPARNIKVVMNYDVREVGKVRYQANPELQNGGVKKLLGAPSDEKLLSRQLLNGEIEYYNPSKNERRMIKNLGLDKSGREGDLDKFISERRTWARYVINQNNHARLSPMEINNSLARDGIGTPTGLFNSSRLQTIYGCNGSGFMPTLVDGVWTDLRYASVDVLDLDFFSRSNYRASDLVWRKDVIDPIVNRAISKRNEWQKMVQGLQFVAGVGAAGSTLYMASQAIDETLKGRLQTRFLNTAPNEMLYGVDSSHMPQPSAAEVAGLGVKLTGKHDADAAAMNIFKKGADGRWGLKGTTELQREYEDAIKQYTAQSKTVVDLGLEVGSSAAPGGPLVEKLKQSIRQADSSLDSADMALRSRQMLLQLWSIGLRNFQGETLVPKRDSVTPAYITNELRSIESTQGTVVGYRAELQKGKQALATAQLRQDTLTGQSISSAAAQIAANNLQQSKEGVKTSRLNLQQAQASSAEAKENNLRNRSRDAFSQWSAPIIAANAINLRGYGDSASAAPRITLAGVQEVVLAPPIVNGVAQTLEQRLDNTLARVNTFPKDAFYWASTQLSVPESTLQLELANARKGLTDANATFEKQFGRPGGASTTTGSSANPPRVPNAATPEPNPLPTIAPGKPLSFLNFPDSGGGLFNSLQRPLLASRFEGDLKPALPPAAEKKNDAPLISAATGKVSFSELTSAALLRSNQAQAATLEVMSALRQRRAAGGLPDITASGGLTFPLMPALGFNIQVVNPSIGPLKRTLDAKTAVAQAAQVDVGAQISLEVAQYLNRAQIYRVQIERDSIKLHAIDDTLAEVQARIGAGVASAADTVPLIEDKDKLNLSLSENRQALERELNALAELSGRPVSADDLRTLMPSSGVDFIARQPALPPFDRRTAGVDPQTLIDQFANRQNTQVVRAEKEIDAAKAALIYAKSQRLPKLSIGFSFPFIPSIRLSGGNSKLVNGQIAEAKSALDKAQLTLEGTKLRNATEIRGAASRARADDPLTNDASWQQRIVNADDLLFGTAGGNGARSGGLLAAYRQKVAAYQAGTASKADVLRPYLLLVDALHNRALASLKLVADVITLRYAMGELDTAQEQSKLFGQLDALYDPTGGTAASVPVPVFGEAR
jgi:hypothetical protein